MAPRILSAVNRPATLRYFLLFFAGLSSLIVVISLLFYEKRLTRARETIMQREMVSLEQEKDAIKNDFTAIFADLVLLAGNPRLREMAGGSGAGPLPPHLAPDICTDPPGYERLLILEKSGEEALHISCTASSESSHQSSSGGSAPFDAFSSQPFFRELARGGSGGVLVSPFTILFDRRESFAAEKSRILFGIALPGDHGEGTGYLVLSYLPDRLFSSFAETTDLPPGRLLVFMSEDSRASRPPAGKEESQAFPGQLAPPSPFAPFARVWEDIVTTRDEQFFSDGHLFTLMSFLSPFGLFDRHGQGPDPDPQRLIPSFKLVSCIPAAFFEERAGILFRRLLLIDLVLLPLSGLLCWIAACQQVRHRTAEAQLQEREARIRAIMNNALEGIVSIDGEGLITAFNPAAAAIFGYSPEEVLGRPISILVPSPHAEQHDAYIRRFIDSWDPGGLIGSHREVQGMRRDGSLVPLELSVSALRLNDTWTFTGMVRDISKRKEMEKKLLELATTDGLTGLFNRSYFNRKLAEEFERAERYRTPLSLILIDVDHFKSVNDTYGHQAGDAYLRAISALIRDLVRTVDTAARFGGEELVIILPHTDEKNARILAERLREKAARLQVTHAGHRICRTISVGVATLGHHRQISMHEFLKIADSALYRAKEEGRNRVVF